MGEWPYLTQSGCSPHGERGLKFLPVNDQVSQGLSLPTRGAWIEITASPSPFPSGNRRSPHGERGLKLLSICRFSISAFVAPPTGGVGWNNLGSKKLVVVVGAAHTGSVD